MIEEIGIMNAEVKNDVQEIINNTFQQPPMNIRRNWYY
jgi:hypothetical protein